MKNWLSSIFGGKDTSAATASAAPSPGGAATPLLDRVPADLRERAVEKIVQLSQTETARAMASRTGSSDYRSAGTRPRTAGGQNAGSLSVSNRPARSVLTAKAQGAMRARCRAVARNNSVVRTLMRRKCEHIVGDGFLFRVRTGDKVWDKKATEHLRRAAKRVQLWRISQWVVRAWDTDGDAMVLKVRGADGVCRLQAIEADLLVTPDMDGNPLVFDDGAITVLPGGGMITAGVETDKDGKVVAYHVAEWGDVEALRKEAAKSGKAATGTGTVWSGSSGAFGIGTVKRLPAEMVMFLTPETFGNPGQHRGEPGLQATLPLAELLYKFMEDVLVAADMATLFALVIAAADPAKEAQTDDASLTDESMSMAAQVAAGHDPEWVLESGLVKYVGQVGAVHQVKPEFPQVGAPEFINTVVRFMAAEHGLAPAIAMFDTASMSASNMKTILSLIYRGFETPMKVLEVDLWEAFGKFELATAIANGQIDTPPMGEAFVPWMEAIKVSTPYPPVMDQYNEFKGWDLGVAKNLTTHDEACLQMGYGDGDEIAERRAEEIERDRQLGITPAEAPGAKRPGEGSTGGGSADAGTQAGDGTGNTA